MNWNIGIDLGAHGARMAMKGRALVLRQASACALRGGKVLALGDEARRMEGRAPQAVEIVYPMKNGAIASESALRAWLGYVMERCGLPARGVRLLIARPPEMALSQMRALSALALEMGAAACALVRSDLAAALGAGIGLADKKARLIVQLGGGSISATLEAGLRVAACETLPYGIDRADEAVRRMLRARHGLAVGPVTAECVKSSLAGAALTEQVVGLDLESGFPRQAQVDVAAVAECVAPLVAQVPELARRVLDAATPEMIEDLIDEGIVLTGGGAQVYGLDKQIAEATGLDCRIAEDPSACVARGLEVLLDAPDDYQYLLEGHQTLLEKRLTMPLGVR